MSAKPRKEPKKRVKFALTGEKGRQVYVAGTFNNWDPTKTRMTWKAGVYTAVVWLPRGRYEYKFVVDGVWQMDPQCQEWAPNGLGSLNSVIVVQ